VTETARFRILGSVSQFSYEKVRFPKELVMGDRKYYSLPTAARELGVSTDVLRQQYRNGLIPAMKTPGGHLMRRIARRRGFRNLLAVQYNKQVNRSTARHSSLLPALPLPLFWRPLNYVDSVRGYEPGRCKRCPRRRMKRSSGSGGVA